ncbi:alpha/beta hydrolase, partial [Pseudomonas aeruginosa]|nr:alpha/beta hydrolase [Pseudomonas aeruginosa]
TARIPRTRLLGRERRFEVRHRPAQAHARLEHPQLGVYAAELVELGYFGGRLHAELPESRPQRGWRLCYDGLADLDILPLRSTAGGFAFIFPHSDPAASAGLADLLAAWQRAEVA